jgi:hypothetical protein
MSKFRLQKFELISFLFFSGIKSVLENLPELWDDSQYEEEYGMADI